MSTSKYRRRGSLRRLNARLSRLEMYLKSLHQGEMHRLKMETERIRDRMGQPPRRRWR